ncbi:MAG: gliding motility-associated C-terminal domain-containing protein [Bacteroidetes bacterium]|nr:gliding motility-associated C-terminal domain-containing protein [Bacteroidota bacterium]
MRYNFHFGFYLNFLLWLVAPILLHGQQICEGNLGENIFTSGDFGSGSATILAQDPGIAPGYNYTTSPPPSDGWYTITNNMGNWSNIYGSWLGVSDNSSDPHGYMMVVNASYTPGLFYEQIVDGLCENTLYVFSADVINVIKTGTANHIKPEVSFLIDDEVKYSSGQIPQDQSWKTFGFTFTTAPNVTSVKLSLRNNAPGGIGNDLALDNITFRPCGPEALILPETIANICEDGAPKVLEATVLGDQYDTPAFQWQQSFDEGLTWSDIPGANSATYTHSILSSGYYYYRYLLANGSSNLQNSKCRVNSNVKIVFVVPKFYTVIDTICEGLNYMAGNSLYDKTGVYVDTLLSSIGCDSIVTLDLTIIADTEIDANISISPPSCYNYSDAIISIDTILGGGSPLVLTLDETVPDYYQSFTDLEAGLYSLYISDRFGCDYQEEVSIQNPAVFEIDLGPDIIIDLGEYVELEPQTNYPIGSLSWYASDSTNCPLNNCYNSEWQPFNSTLVQLQANSEKGCIAYDTIQIEVEKNRKIFIPNAISANSDNINDHFTLYADQSSVQFIKKMQIFNRWGSLLYEKQDFAPNQPTQGWNGKYLGKIMGEGVYTYYIEVLFLDNVIIPFMGTVTILK